MQFFTRTSSKKVIKSSKERVLNKKIEALRSRIKNNNILLTLLDVDDPLTQQVEVESVRLSLEKIKLSKELSRIKSLPNPPTN